MECPNCGGHMGLEEAFCPYCNTPNAMAAQHASDMARFRREYQRTQADVLEKTSLMQRTGSWLVILAVLLVALVAGIVLQSNAWDIGYSIRTGNVESNMAEARQTMDALLEEGEYGRFYGYYDANDISLGSDTTYQGVWMAARAYVDILQYVPSMNGSSDYRFEPEYISTTCRYVAEDLNRIYTLEQSYSYDLDRYLPADKLVYVEDIRNRVAAIAKAYYGLTDSQIREIPDMSTKKLASLLEEGVAR